MPAITSIDSLASINSTSTAESESSGSRVKKATNKLKSVNITRQSSKANSQLAAYDSREKITSRNISGVDNNDSSISPDFSSKAKPLVTLPRETQPEMTDSAKQAALIKELTERLAKEEKTPPILISATLSQQIEENRNNPKKPEPTPHSPLVPMYNPAVQEELNSVVEKRGKVN